MPLIEGIGDEVVIFFTVLLLTFIFILAWLSTNVSEIPLVSVIVLDRSTFQNVLTRIRNGATAFVHHNITFRTDAGNETASPNADQVDEALIEPEFRANLVIRPTTADEDNLLNGVEDLLLNPLADDLDENIDDDEEAVDDDFQATTASTIQQPSNTDEDQTESSGSSEETRERSHPFSEAENQVLDTKELRNKRVEFFSRAGQEKTNIASLVSSVNDDNNRSKSTKLGETAGASTSIHHPATEAGSKVASCKKDQISPVCHSSSSSSSSATPDSATVDPSLSDLHCQTASQPESPLSYPSPSSPLNSEDLPELLDGHIRIKLKYLDDRQRLVQAKPQETVAEFKRKHFAPEIEDNVMVRFIHNGQELKQESMTLQAYNLQDNSIVHCLISRTTQVPDQAVSDTQIQEFDMGLLMFPIFGLILGLVWYLRIMYRGYFNAMSTFSLVAITFMFFVALLASRNYAANHEHVD